LLGTDFDKDANCYGVFDNGIRSRLGALLNLVKTIFICLILSTSYYFFIKDTNTLVIEPIDSIISKIRVISNNPMEAINNMENIENLQEKIFITPKKSCCISPKSDKIMETTILDKTISKIANLLAIGLGENGSNILSRSLKNNQQQEINTIIEGNETVAIYSFCQIFNFYEIFDSLKENVLIFINEIAEIIHEITDENFGFVDKNIGEGFSLVWRVEDYMTKNNPSSKKLEVIKSISLTNIIEASVISILKIIMKIHKKKKFLKVLNF